MSLFALVAHGLTGVAVAWGEAGVGLHYSDVDFLWIFLVVSFALSLGCLFARRRTTARIVLVCEAVVFFALQRFLGSLLFGELLLGLSIVGQISIYDEYPVNITAGVGFAVLVLLNSIRHSLGTIDFDAAVGMVALATGLAVLAVALSQMSRYREELIDVQGRYARMDRSIGQLTRLNQEYQDSLVRAESESTEKERRRITRDIHDVVGYTLTNNIMLMEAATDMARINPLGVTRMLTTARENAQEGLQRMRQILYALRRESSQAPHGATALAKLVSTFETATGIAVAVDYTNLRTKLPYRVDLTLYHIVQEGLVNAFRHGESTRVGVMLSEHDGAVQLVLSDNGTGTDGVVSGIGLQGMTERVNALEGSLTWHSSSYGFTIKATIPLSRKDDGQDDSASAG